MAEPYREHRPRIDLEPIVACVWEHAPARPFTQRIIPDGCVDIVWLADRELIIAGPDTGPRSVDLPPDAQSTGVRLRPGAGGAIFRIPVSELRDQDVPAELVWGERALELAEALASSPPAGRAALLEGAVAAAATVPDLLVRAAAHRLAARGTRVAGLAAELGVSERQLRRRMLQSVGYGPKMLARVARLRRLIAGTDPTLAGRALDAGYASQAHMTDEVRRLTGTTPVRFLEDATLTAA